MYDIIWCIQMVMYDIIRWIQMVMYDIIWCIQMVMYDYINVNQHEQVTGELTGTLEICNAWSIFSGMNITKHLHEAYFQYRCTSRKKTNGSHS